MDFAHGIVWRLAGIRRRLMAPPFFQCRAQRAHEAGPARALAGAGLRAVRFSVCRVLAYVWAAPNTLLGLAVGGLALLLGGQGGLRDGTLEIVGGTLGRLACRLPAPIGFCAITLGHVVLATDATTLAVVRAHEQAHVRQYERWGPLFIPAYLLSSLLQLSVGRHPYRDNSFECQARAVACRKVRGVA